MIKEFIELEAVVWVTLQELLYKMHQVQDPLYFIEMKYGNESIEFYKIPKNSNWYEYLFTRDLFHAKWRGARLNNQTSETIIRIHKVLYKPMD